MGRVRRGVGLAGLTLACLAFVPGVANADIDLDVCTKQSCETVTIPTSDIPPPVSGWAPPLVAPQVCAALGSDLGDVEIPIGEDSVVVCPADGFGRTAVDAEVGGTRVGDWSYSESIGPYCPCSGQGLSIGEELGIGISSYHRP